MKLAWPFYLARKHLFPTGRGVSFFSLLAVFGVALGVNVMIVVIVFMKGFQHKFREDAIAVTGHARAYPNGPASLSEDGSWESALARLEALPETESAAPVLTDYVLLSAHDQPVAPLLIGFDPERADATLPLPELIEEASRNALRSDLDATPPPNMEDVVDGVVLLSEQLANLLGVRPAQAQRAPLDKHDADANASAARVTIHRLDPFVASGLWGLRFENAESYRLIGPEGEPWETLHHLRDGPVDNGEGVPVFTVSPEGPAFEANQTVLFHVSESSTVQLYSAGMLQKAGEEELLPPREARVGGLFKVPPQQTTLPAEIALAPLSFAQEICGMEGKVHFLQIRFAPETVRRDSDLLATTAKAEKALGKNWFARPWIAEADWLFTLLKFEEHLMILIMVPIGLVAAFAIAIALMTSVLRKTREIGLLTAMGANRTGVGAVFCFQGFVIGLLGTLAGWVMALLFIRYRENLMNFIVQNVAGEDGTGAVVEFYDFHALVVPYPWQSPETLEVFLLFGLFAVLIATLAGLLPAWKAARLKPAEALRSE